MDQQQAANNGAYFAATVELGKLLGLSKSASLALAVLFTHHGSLCLDEIAAQTDVAKSSSSVILRDLAQLGLVKSVDRPHDRRKFYQITPDLSDAAATLIARRLSQFTTQWEGIRLDSETVDDAERLAQLWKIYASLEQLATLFAHERSAAWDVIQHRLINEATTT